MNQSYPRVSVAMVLRRNGLKLLGLRKGSHGDGQWGFPGGAVDLWENPKDAVIRETYEETGILLDPVLVHPVKSFPWFDDQFPDEGKHFLLLFFSAIAPDNAEALVMEADKCVCWRWFKAKELFKAFDKGALFQGTDAFVAQWGPKIRR